MRFLTRGLLALALVAAAPQPSHAWSFEVHRYIMATAIPLLPPAIRPFFVANRTAIVEHAIDPDLWRTAGWEEEPPRHFLDMDAYGAWPFPELPHVESEAVARYGREFVTKNGLLPWRTEEIYTKLVEAFRQQAPYSRENIKFFSSVLAHYVSDAYVPFHAAVNHDGQLTKQWGIHSRFESDLFARYRARLNVTPAPAVPVTSAREHIFATLTQSFTFVEPVLVADRVAVKGRSAYDDKYFNLFFNETQGILERRLGGAVTGVVSMISAAWVEAGRPALRVDVPRVARPVRRQ
jgi:hypothetical protein